MKRRSALRALLFTAGFMIPACTQKQNSTQNQVSSSQTQATATQNSGAVELTLVGYGVAKALYSKMIPAFQQEWKAKTGQDVKFKESYGGSGAQTRAILGGLQADILAQNLQSNLDPLVEKGFVSMVQTCGEFRQRFQLAGHALRARAWCEHVPVSQAPARSPSLHQAF